MKIYFASSSKIWEDPAWVSGILDAGFDGWEISADGNYRLDNPETFAVVKKTIAETGLPVTVHAPFSDLNPASVNTPIWEETVHQLEATIEAAAEITDTVVIHPGYLSPASRYDPTPAWQNHKRACERLGAAAEKTGVSVCLENMPNLDDFFCRDADELDGLIDGTGMSAVFDIGHANTNGNLDRFCKVILPKACHIHIHDNLGGHDDHLPIGCGNISWNKISPKVTKSYHGKIMVVEGRSPDEGRKSLTFLKEHL
ncbi:MAG TPA: sugar phosphate isomerase/epimerase [Methanocorpusculum sp.]|nr:sugar phosphate isomerase/epimerase [Methanocorpusculum sp.]